MRKIKHTLLLISLLTPLSMLGQWETQGDKNFGSAPGFSGGTRYMDLEFHNDTAFVLFRDDTRGGKTSCMKLQDTAWVNVGTPGFSAGSGYFQDMEIDNNGNIYSVYKDGGNNWKATVMKYSGTDWDTVNTNISDGQANYTNMEIINNEVYIAYNDGNSGKIQVKKYTGSSWFNVGTPDFATAHEIDMTQYNDTLYVAYRDDANSSSLAVHKFNGTDWEIVGASGVSWGIVSAPSIAVDENDGSIYVSYTDNALDYKLSVKKFDGSSWSTVGNEAFTDTSALYSDITIYNGVPYVSYSDNEINGYVSTVMLVDGRWEYVGAQGWSNDRPITIAGLSFKWHNGEAWVAYAEGAGKENSVAKFKCYASANVSLFGNTLSASGNNMVYRWLNCNTNTLADSAFDKSFTPDSIGDYALISITGPCRDTSSCLNNTCNVDTSVSLDGTTLTANADPNSSFQWIDCDNGNADITGETSQTFTPSSNGTYAVRITQNSCSGTSGCHVVNASGIAAETSNSVRIYPNPATNELFIERSKFANQIQNIRIMDITGRSVQRYPGTVNQINISELPEGIYILRISGKGTMINKTFIKR